MAAYSLRSTCWSASRPRWECGSRRDNSFRHRWSWGLINEQRKQIALVLKDSPSLDSFMRYSFYLYRRSRTCAPNKSIRVV